MQPERLTDSSRGQVRRRRTPPTVTPTPVPFDPARQRRELKSAASQETACVPIVSSPANKQGCHENRLSDAHSRRLFLSGPKGHYMRAQGIALGTGTQKRRSPEKGETAKNVATKSQKPTTVQFTALLSGSGGLVAAPSGGPDVRRDAANATLCPAGLQLVAPSRVFVTDPPSRPFIGCS